MNETLTRYEKRAKRESIFQQINETEELFCTGCPFREQPITACPKCKHSEHFTKLGEALDELAVGYQPSKKAGRKRNFDLSALTREKYIEMKRNDYSDSEVGEEFGANKNAISVWKRKNNISQKDWQ